MSERTDWSAVVTDLAGKVGLAKGSARAEYPEPENDHEAVAYLRHLAANLSAVATNRDRHAGASAQSPTTAIAVAAQQNTLADLDAELDHLLMVIARHGYGQRTASPVAEPEPAAVTSAPEPVSAAVPATS